LSCCTTNNKKGVKHYSAIIFEFAFNLSTSHLILNLLCSYTEEIEKKFFISTQSFFFVLLLFGCCLYFHLIETHLCQILRVREENLREKLFFDSRAALIFSWKYSPRKYIYCNAYRWYFISRLLSRKKIKTRKFSWHTKCQALTLNLKLVQKFNECDYIEGDRSAFVWDFNNNLHLFDESTQCCWFYLLGQIKA